ncbi:MAG: hypothetical protein ACTSQJ_09460 [Promethearchaeota archaeon]
MINTVKRIVYCETCEREVILRRKNFDHIYHEIICFMVLTVILIPLYLILKYARKKNTCPNCESKFDLKKLPKRPKLHMDPNLIQKQNIDTQKII